MLTFRIGTWRTSKWYSAMLGTAFSTATPQLLTFILMHGVQLTFASCQERRARLCFIEVASLAAFMVSGAALKSQAEESMNKHRAMTKQAYGKFLGILLCGIISSGLAPLTSKADGVVKDNNSAGSAPVVSTVDGRLRGLVRNGIDIFLGIPYAAPPVGNLRWQPPQPVKRWQDVRDATQYAPTCSQVTELGAFAGPSSTSEDCLYLNVFTAGAVKNGKKRPVLVWIHGGANVDGASNDYDASKLASGGPNGVPTVVVTLNYRLGLFGFFSHPAIDSEGHLSGNYGILDQQAVLRWVQRNIAAFGGDPDRVALGGQSAGAVDTAANMISPYGSGLFNRAILQSSPGFLASNFVTRDVAEGHGVSFAKAAGCSASSNSETAKCLRDLSAARILQLQGTTNADGRYGSGMLSIDGNIIPLTPDQAFNTGSFNKMPIMGGGTRDELTFITGITQYFSGPPQTPMTAAQYSAAVAAGAPCTFCVGGAIPAGTAARYPLSNYNGDPMLAYARVTTDSVRCQEVNVLERLASQVPSYAYDFTYQHAPYYFPKMPGFKPLAAHTIDIQFVFDKWHGGQLGVNLDQTTGQPRDLNQKEENLSDQMVAAWTNFASTGNPNGTGNTPWPKLVTGNTGKYLLEDVPLSTQSVAQFRAHYQCDFWNAISGN